MYSKYTQKCIPHFDKNFCILFVNKIYIKFCRNVGYILYTDILYSLHFAYINSDLQKIYHKTYVYNLYSKLMQNVYTNKCMQNGTNPIPYAYLEENAKFV